jgi:putative aminopeptidase FrvX
MGLESETDAKGNLLVRFGSGEPDIVVTAHMDEIAMIVREMKDDGTLAVKPLGGLHPWKLGEGPVEILTRDQTIPGVFGFGGIHTEDPAATTVKAKDKGVDWAMGSVFTGLSGEELREKGVRPGSRVVVARSRRPLTKLKEHVAGYFLDDRADIVAWLLVLEQLKGFGKNVLFAATAAEEVGGEGALFLLNKIRPAICIALELGADVPDAKVKLTATPTVWSIDGYAATSAADLDLLDDLGKELGMPLQFQAFSRGGSDASCAASRGLCARPITLGLPMGNSHGYEIMHRDAMSELATLTAALLIRLSA